MPVVGLGVIDGQSTVPLSAVQQLAFEVSKIWSIQCVFFESLSCILANRRYTVVALKRVDTYREQNVVFCSYGVYGD